MLLGSVLTFASQFWSGCARSEAYFGLVSGFDLQIGRKQGGHYHLQDKRYQNYSDVAMEPFIRLQSWEQVPNSDV